MCKFSFSPKLASLCVIAISIGVLLVLNFPAEAEVNSPTLTRLDMEEMSQIAGGQSQCQSRFYWPAQSPSGSCRPNGSSCQSGSQCGSSRYTVYRADEYCDYTPTGYYYCSCGSASPGWDQYDCQRCVGGVCSRRYRGNGGYRIACQLSRSCP